MCLHHLGLSTSSPSHKGPWQWCWPSVSFICHLCWPVLPAAVHAHGTSREGDFAFAMMTRDWALPAHPVMLFPLSSHLEAVCVVEEDSAEHRELRIRTGWACSQSHFLPLNLIKNMLAPSFPGPALPSATIQCVICLPGHHSGNLW